MQQLAFWQIRSGKIVPIFFTDYLWFPPGITSASFTVKNANAIAMTIVWHTEPGFRFSTVVSTTLLPGQTKTVVVHRTTPEEDVGMLTGTWTCGADSGNISPIELDAS